MLYYGVFAIEQHYQHRHGLDVLLREVGVLKFDEVVLVVDLEAASLAAEAIQESLLRILMVSRMAILRVRTLRVLRIDH